jgi:hypothetical protein
MIDRILYVIALAVLILVELAGILWQLARLAGLVIKGSLITAAYHVAVFAINSLAYFIRDLADIVRWLNHKLGLKP